ADGDFESRSALISAAMPVLRCQSLAAAELDRQPRLYWPGNDPATTLRSPTPPGVPKRLRRGGPGASRFEQDQPRGICQSAFPSKVAPVRSVLSGRSATPMIDLSARSRQSSAKGLRLD